MGVEGVPHGQDDVETEEKVEGEGDVLEELQKVEVRRAKIAHGCSLVHSVECGDLEQVVELEVADDLGDAHLRDHSLPRDNTLTDAHVVDQLVWVRHELLVISHHKGDRACNAHRYQAEEARQGYLLELVLTPVIRFHFLTGLWLVDILKGILGFQEHGAARVI